MGNPISLLPKLLSECRPVPAGWTVVAYFEGWGIDRDRLSGPQPEMHVLHVLVNGVRGLYIQKGPASETMLPLSLERQRCIDRVFQGQRPFVALQPPLAIPLRSGCYGWLALDEAAASSDGGL